MAVKSVLLAHSRPSFSNLVAATCILATRGHAIFHPVALKSGSQLTFGNFSKHVRINSEDPKSDKKEDNYFVYFKYS